MKMRSLPTSLYSLLSRKFPSGGQQPSDVETFSLFFLQRPIVDLTIHRITGIVDWVCVSCNRPGKLPPGFRNCSKDPRLMMAPPIPDAAPPPEEDADEIHKEMQENLEQILLRRVFYDETGRKYGSGHASICSRMEWRR